MTFKANQGGEARFAAMEHTIVSSARFSPATDPFGARSARPTACRRGRRGDTSPAATTLVFAAVTAAFGTAASAAPSEVCTGGSSEAALAAVADRTLPIDRERGYVVEEIAEGVHFASDGNFSMALVESAEGLVLIDAPTSMGAMIAEIAAGISERPISHVVYTHAHADHIGGAAVLDGPIEVIAGEGARHELARVNTALRTYPFGTFVGGGGTVPSPTVIVEGSHVLRLGGRIIQFDTLEAGHSHGDMVAYLPEERVLVAVDFTWPAAAPWIRLGDAVNVPGLIAQNETLLTYEFDHLVAGHFAIVGERSDVETTIEYLNDVRDASAAALKTVTVEQAAERLGSYETYPLMDVYFQMVIDAAAEPILAEWSDRLQGVGTWACTHVQKMVASLRFDEMREIRD